jgi:hypothetical protein
MRDPLVGGRRAPRRLISPRVGSILALIATAFTIIWQISMQYNADLNLPVQLVSVDDVENGAGSPAPGLGQAISGMFFPKEEEDDTSASVLVNHVPDPNAPKVCTAHPNDASFAIPRCALHADNSHAGTGEAVHGINVHWMPVLHFSHSCSGQSCAHESPAPRRAVPHILIARV